MQLQPTPAAVDADRIGATVATDYQRGRFERGQRVGPDSKPAGRGGATERDRRGGSRSSQFQRTAGISHRAEVAGCNRARAHKGLHHRDAVVGDRQAAHLGDVQGAAQEDLVTHHQVDAIGAERTVDAQRIRHDPKAGTAQIDRRGAALRLQLNHVANDGDLVQSGIIKYLFSATDNPPDPELDQGARCRLGGVGQLQHQLIGAGIAWGFAQLQRRHLTGWQYGIAQFQRDRVAARRAPECDR